MVDKATVDELFNVIDDFDVIDELFAEADDVFDVVVEVFGVDRMSFEALLEVGAPLTTRSWKRIQMPNREAEMERFIVVDSVCYENSPILWDATLFI